MQLRKIIISGGGTGGHIFPAIAIADSIKEKFPDAEFLFIGAKDRMEMEKVPAAGYKIEGLWISGLQRRLTYKNFLVPIKVISSLLKASKIIKNFKPDIVIGVGGFASGPTLKVACKKGIPTLIQEQNSFPGITNRLLASKVDRICVAYEKMDKYFPKDKITVTGNPVREKVVDIEGKKEEALKRFGLNPDYPVALVVGGSLGSKTINETIHSGIKTFLEKEIQVIWQTGKSYADEAKEIAKHSDGWIKAYSFISTMDLAYAAADVVISRAGAIAVSELSLVHKPAILVPSPNVAEDHQTKNAMALVMHNAALLIEDKKAKEDLIPAIIELVEQDEMKEKLSRNIKSLAMHNATRAIRNVIEQLVEKKK